MRISPDLVPIISARIPPWVLNGAVLDLYFANSLYYGATPSGLTVSRASVAYMDDTLGNWTQFAANMLRLSDKGALIEEARTNVTLWCCDLTNAVWAKTNVTAAMDQTGPDNVANSASSITATAGNGTALQAITLASSARFQSAFVKRITGTGVVNLTMDNGATWTAVTVTSAWTRVSIPTQTIANPTVGFQIVTSGDKIAVAFIQNENGTFATSPIRTTSAAATRAADVVTLASPPAFGVAGTAFVQVTNLEAPSVSASRRWLEINDGTTSNRILLQQSSATQSQARIDTGSVLQANPLFTVTLSNRQKLAAAWATNDFAAVDNGGTPGTASSVTVPVVNTVNIGSGAGGTAQADGYIERVALWPNVRLTNAVLQALTT